MDKIRQAAHQFFHDAKMTETWLNTPCRSFDNKSPIDYATSPELEAKVLQYLQTVCANGKA